MQPEANELRAAIENRGAALPGTRHSMHGAPGRKLYLPQLVRETPEEPWLPEQEEHEEHDEQEQCPSQMESTLALGGKNSSVGKSMRLNMSQGLSDVEPVHSFSGIQKS